VTFGRALRRSNGGEPHKLGGPDPRAFHEPITNFIGYPWYDALSCFIRTGECFTHDGDQAAASEPGALTQRPRAIRIELTDQHGSPPRRRDRLRHPGGRRFLGDPDCAVIALTRGSELDPNDLTDLIIDAVFSPSDDSDADSYDAQETRFRHDAAVRAHAILEGDDAAILAGIRMAFADRVAWRIPHGRKLQLTWSSWRQRSHSCRRAGGLRTNDPPSEARCRPGHHRPDPREDRRRHRPVARALVCDHHAAAAP